MSKINYQALREAAEKATKGSYIVGHTSVNQHGNITGVFVCQKWKGEPGGVIAECHVNCLVETDAQAYANAEFIAEVNPATMLALLDEREAQNKCIAELEKIATDYALKFQKAQDALKHVVLMRKSEQEAADNNLIDSECRVAELEEALRDKQALLEASEKRIAELRDWNAGLAQESLTYQQRVAELEVIKSAAEKLVRCKGRYHSEQNYRALAALFGVTVPDLPPLEAEPVSQTYNLPELIEGMEVSIDVSTCDADLGNRYFGTVTEALELDTAKNGYILLVQDAEPNFDVNGNYPVTPDGWIPVSERMPEPYEYVLVTDGFDGCEVMRVNADGYWGPAKSLYPGSITHWMPLPAAPQQEVK